MEISKYQELCKTFDQVLKNSASTPQIIANNYLHILNASPEFLKRFDLSKIGKIQALIRFKLISIIRALQSIFDGAHYYTRQEETESEVLFVSHLTNKKQVLRGDDAYFQTTNTNAEGNFGNITFTSTETITEISTAIGEIESFYFQP